MLQSLSGEQQTTEPSFISPVYGLQGRLDLLVEHQKQPQRKDILELKSGKPYTPPKREHLIQVACQEAGQLSFALHLQSFLIRKAYAQIQEIFRHYVTL